MGPRVLPPVDLELPKDFDHEQPYERDRKRMAMVTQRSKVAHYVFDDDRARLERLVGMNSFPNQKQPTLVERYPKEWAELHTPQEKLDYEKRMRKYRPRDFFTPYQKEWHDVRRPDRGLWRAPTPLHDEISQRSAVIPDETKLKFDTTLAKKRQSLRAMARRNLEIYGKKAMVAVEDVKYRAAGLRATLSTPKTPDGDPDAPRGRGAIRVKGKMASTPQASPEAKRPHTAPAAAGGETPSAFDQRRGDALEAWKETATGQSAPKLKRSFFKLPGNYKRPEEDDPKAKVGARSSVAKRLFMKKTIVKPRNMGEAPIELDTSGDFAFGSIATIKGAAPGAASERAS